MPLWRDRCHGRRRIRTASARPWQRSLHVRFSVATDTGDLEAESRAPRGSGVARLISSISTACLAALAGLALLTVSLPAEAQWAGGSSTHTLPVFTPDGDLQYPRSMREPGPMARRLEEPDALLPEIGTESGRSGRDRIALVGGESDAVAQRVQGRQGGNGQLSMGTSRRDTQ